MSSDAYALPCVPLREMVLFPHVTIPVFVVRGRALATVESLPPAATRLFLVAQRDFHEEDPEIEGLHQVGTEAEILQILRLSDGTIKVLVEGLGRCLVREYYYEDETLWAEVLPGEEPGEESPDLMARGRGLLSRRRGLRSCAPRRGSGDRAVTAGERCKAAA